VNEDMKNNGVEKLMFWQRRHEEQWRGEVDVLAAVQHI
jgi:hypothetical protein